MDSLTNALLPIRWEQEGIGKFIFKPPTVRQVLVLYDLLPHWRNDACLVRLKLVLWDWLGESGLLHRLEALNISWEAGAYLFESFIRSCEPEFDEEPEKKEDYAEWVRDGSLGLMIAEYRHWFQADPLDESWPYFLVQSKCLDQLKAEVGIANLAWYAAGKSNDAYKSLIKRAGYSHAGIPEEWQRPEEDDAIQASTAAAIGRIGMIAHQRGQA